MVLAPFVSSIFIPNLFRAFKKRAGALFRSFGSRGPLLRPRRKNTAFRRDWRSVGDPFRLKWAWHSRGVHIFKKRVLSSFLKIQLSVVFCGPPGAFGPLRAPSGGAPGAQQTDQGHDHFEASFRWCFAGAGARPVEHQAANHDLNLCRMPSSLQACVHEPS